MAKDKVGSAAKRTAAKEVPSGATGLRLEEAHPKRTKTLLEQAADEEPFLGNPPTHTDTKH
jgi:hypothetical protein